MTPSMPRTWLFCPADRLDRLGRASATADVAVADLEDAVVPSNKNTARSGLVDWLRSHPDTAKSVWVRVNSDPEYRDADLGALAVPDVPFGGLVVPKAELAVVRSVARYSAKPLLALLETARGLWEVRDIAAAPGVQRLCLGEYDLAAELGTATPEVDSAPLGWARSRVVAAASEAGIPPPPAPVLAVLDDEARFRADTVALQRWGFFGRMCVHPDQVSAVHEALVPTQEEIDRAQAVVDGAEKAQSGGTGALVVNGQMVDRAVVRRAQRTLSLLR